MNNNYFIGQITFSHPRFDGKTFFTVIPVLALIIFFYPNYNNVNRKFKINRQKRNLVLIKTD